MYERHPQLPEIEDPDTVLWRYVDLYRYLDLLQTGELHLARADQMEDPWEGSFSAVNVAMRPELYGEHWEGMSQAREPLYKHSRTHTYLNCWYMGIHESYAMWKLYDAAGKGVAIRTTAARLWSSLIGKHRPPLSGAQVQYADYEKTFIPEGNTFFPFVFKRVSFAHESEYRLLGLWSPKVLETDEHNTVIRAEVDDPPLFLRETMNLSQLIEAVYVSPGAPEWVARVVTEVTGRYMPQLDVKHSSLAAHPVF